MKKRVYRERYYGVPVITPEEMPKEVIKEISEDAMKKTIKEKKRTIKTKKGDK